MNLVGKRILILAGASVHIKLVEAARKMGVYTVVTDNVPDSPAKRIADKSYDINIYDIDGLEYICKAEHIDGIISCYIDPCQRPYAEICDRMNYYCYGNKEQFYKMSDKHAFKKMCKEFGVDVVPEYKEDELDKIEYPVFVKPVDSRGSRGQAVCYNREQLNRAIENAKLEASNGDIIIEKYMAEANEFQVTYFFIDGKPYLIRTCDSYCGSETNHLEKVVACAISPSIFTESYINTAHTRVTTMFKSLGFRNGPIFMQGFEDNGIFRFFDPGLRFPGVDYERIYHKIYDVDLMSSMITLALTGECGDLHLPDDGVWLKGKSAAILFPTIKAGVVSEIDGLNTLLENEGVISFLPRCTIGDEIAWTFNVNQRVAEIDIIADDLQKLKCLIKSIQENFIIRDLDGNDMMYELFDINRINNN